MKNSNDNSGINCNELDYAKSIFRKEIAGLEMMMSNVGSSLIEAIDLIYSKRGHVIVSGMGKPGHVGRKISATLSSTGTHSFFLHPAEASHGDLGGVSPDDTLFVLSLSGNTAELIPMLSYANRFGIDIIAITANRDSVLAKSAKINIFLPIGEEACPHNLAPTTSTTIMMVTGDAIAMCLLKRREFNRENFKDLHPGGTLGKQLLMVKDLMHTDVPVVGENNSMKDVIIEMTSKSFGCTCVVNGDNKIVGIITDGDLRRNMGTDLLEKIARDVMTSMPKLVSKNTFLQEATRIMNLHKITNLFVTEDGTPEGIIHVHDCLREGIV
jgi:arabinose-5-phosphate isomerase